MLRHDIRGTGPAVVLVHGHPFDRSMWSPQLRSLSSSRQVIAPDLRGFGESPHTPGTVGMGELADDIWALLAELGIGDIAVVGLSMGGLIAMEMAIARPQRVWALGLIATTAQPVDDAEPRRRRELADRVEAEGLGVLVESMAPQLFGPEPEQETVERVVAMMAGNNPHGAAAALRGRAARPDYRPGLRALALPSFVCTGTHDVYSTAAVTRELVACLSAPRTLTLDDVGHLPNLERPDQFNAELSSFLDDAWGQVSPRSAPRSATRSPSS